MKLINLSYVHCNKPVDWEEYVQNIKNKDGLYLAKFTIIERFRTSLDFIKEKAFEPDNNISSLMMEKINEISDTLKGYNQELLKSDKMQAALKEFEKLKGESLEKLQSTFESFKSFIKPKQ